MFGLLLAATGCGPVTISEVTPTRPPATIAPPTGTPTFTPIPTYAPPTDTPTPTNTPTPDPGAGPINPMVHPAEDAEAVASNNEEVPWLLSDMLQDYRLGTRTVPLELSAKLTTDAITWDNWWCAATDALLAGNVAVMQTKYEINGEELDLETQAFIFRQHLSSGAVCQVTAFYLTDWPSGEHELKFTFTLTGNINDGFGTYAPGDYVTVYKVTAP